MSPILVQPSEPLQKMDTIYCGSVNLYQSGKSTTEIKTFVRAKGKNEKI